MAISAFDCFLPFTFCVLAEHRALRIQAHPTDTRPLENVREHSLFIDLPGSAFIVQHIGSIRHRNLA